MVGRCRGSCFVFFFWREVFPLGEIGGVQDTGVVSWACFPGDGVWGASGWQPSLLLLPVQPCIPCWCLLARLTFLFSPPCDFLGLLSSEDVSALLWQSTPCVRQGLGLPKNTSASKTARREMLQPPKSGS